MFKGIGILEFQKKFFDNDSCFEYLVDYKWSNGFKCRRCGFTESLKGKTRFHKRCKECKYDESVTANTLFHDTKMPILKAFHMLFRLSAKKKGMSTTELASEVGVEQKTAWLFKRKVQVAMKQEEMLNGKVDVDETVLGFHTDRAHCGRNLEIRKALMIGAEILPDGRTGNIRLQEIKDFKADTLQSAIENMVKPAASIRSDEYKSYKTLQIRGMNIKLENSEKGQAFLEIHRQIMQFKNWLIGIHHKWSRQHLHAYADEYVFRFNRRNCRGRIFHSLIERMMGALPHPYPKLKSLCA